MAEFKFDGKAHWVGPLPITFRRHEEAFGGKNCYSATFEVMSSVHCQGEAPTTAQSMKVARDLSRDLMRRIEGMALLLALKEQQGDPWVDVSRLDLHEMRRWADRALWDHLQAGGDDDGPVAHLLGAVKNLIENADREAIA